MKRRCGFVPQPAIQAPAIVWARGRISSGSCPVSYISPESKALLEEFQAWKLFGSHDFHHLPAKVVDALLILENELRTEIRNAQE